jgi:hypothetical protein
MMSFRQRCRMWLSTYLDPIAIKCFGYDFFIAYGSDLSDYATRLQSDLEQSRPRRLVCRDKEAPTFGPGANLTDTVIANIRRSHTVVLIDSLQARRSIYVANEIRLALGDPIREGEPPEIKGGRRLIRIARRAPSSSPASWPLNQDQYRTSSPVFWTGGLTDDQIRRLDALVWIREEPFRNDSRVPHLSKIPDDAAVSPIVVGFPPRGTLAEVLTTARWFTSLRRALGGLFLALGLVGLFVTVLFAPSALYFYLRSASQDIEKCLGTVPCVDGNLTRVRGVAEKRLARAVWLNGWWRLSTFEDAARQSSEVLARARAIPLVDVGASTDGIAAEAQLFTRTSPDGAEILSVGPDGVRVGEAGSPQPRKCVGVPLRQQVSVDQSWSRLVELDTDAAPAIWSLEQCTRQLLPPGISRAYAAAFSPDGRLLAIDSGDALHLIDLQLNSARQLPVARRNGRRLMAVSLKGDRLAVADGSIVWMFDTASGQQFPRSAPLAAVVDALVFLLEDDLAVLADGDIAIFTTRKTFQADMPNAIAREHTGQQQRFEGMTFWPSGGGGTLIAGLNVGNAHRLIAFDYRATIAQRLRRLPQHLEVTGSVQLHSGIRGWIPYRHGNAISLLRIRVRE